MKTVDSPMTGSVRSIELDFVRGLAILMVMAAHFSYPLMDGALLNWLAMRFKESGSPGVNLFFTLSGFLVGGLLMKEYQRTGRIEARRFLIRRALKIWPPLYALVIFHALLGRHPLDTFFWQNLLHVQNYFGSALAQTWSLAVEEHFYLFLTCLLTVFMGRSPRVLISVLLALCLMVFLARTIAVLNGSLDAAFRQTQFRIDSLLYGVILAAAHTFYPAHFQRLASRKTLLVLGVVGLIVFVYGTAGMPRFERSVGYVVQSLGFAILLVAVCSHSGGARRWWAYRAMAWMGVYSYGIYLWHSLALEPGRRLIALLATTAVPGPLAWILVGSAQLGLAVTAGYLMTRLVEWPSLQLREHLFPSTSAPGAAGFAAVPSDGQRRPA